MSATKWPGVLSTAAGMTSHNRSRVLLPDFSRVIIATIEQNERVPMTSKKTTSRPLRAWVAHCFIAILLLTPVAWSQESPDEQPLFELDEATWAMFYDLPSRRFRTIRDAFIRKDFVSARRDLQVSLSFLSIESDRAVESLRPPMLENMAEIRRIEESLDDPSVAVGALDSAFARAHWLLAQHYLVQSMRSRDVEQHKAAGRYLWATAHHLERAVLWSDSRVDRQTVRALDSVREMGSDLQSSDRPIEVYRDKPIALAADTLKKIGVHLERKVWITAKIDGA